jgi:hypothetical protein
MSGFRNALRYLEQGVIPAGRIRGTAIINEVIAMKLGSLVLAAIAALGAALAAAPLDKVVPPAVPSELAVYSNETAFLMAHAIGTQNYSCVPAANGGVGWTLFGPQATLFSEDGGQVITHFLSANPDEAGLPRASWQHSRDSSTVWAALSSMSSDAAYVDPNAIPWFLLRTVGKQNGPTSGDRLTQTTAVQRVNTVGGRAPVSGCATASDLGRKALVPYEADYVFYRAR